MSRWKRVVRGMLGTGLTFAVGVGAVSALVGVAAIVFGELTLLEMVQSVARMSVVSFILGVAFSGMLALVARGRTLEKLSVVLVTAIGAGGGFSYFLFLAMNGGRNWTPRVALLNFVLLLVMGAGAAAGTLLVARRARQTLAPSDEMPMLNEQHFEDPVPQRESDQARRR